MDLSYLNNAELRRLAAIEERQSRPWWGYHEELKRRGER